MWKDALFLPARVHLNASKQLRLEKLSRCHETEHSMCYCIVYIVHCIVHKNLMRLKCSRSLGVRLFEWQAVEMVTGSTTGCSTEEGRRWPRWHVVPFLLHFMLKEKGRKWNIIITGWCSISFMKDFARFSRWPSEKKITRHVWSEFSAGFEPEVCGTTLSTESSESSIPSKLEIDEK